MTFRKQMYCPLAELPADLDRGRTEYHEERVHQGRWCYGRTPRQTFLDTIPWAKEKLFAASAIGQQEQPDNEDEITLCQIKC
jgi:hypothetical protein